MFKNKHGNIVQIFEKKSILTVFELYVIEVFKQLKSESLLDFHDGIGLCHYNTKRKENGLLPLNCCLTVTQISGQQIGKGIKLIERHDLIQVDLPKLSTAQTQSHLRKKSLYM